MMTAIGNYKSSTVAQSGGPDISGNTQVAWTDDTYFSAFTSQSGSTTYPNTPISFYGSNNTSFSLWYAHKALSIPADAVNRVAFNPHSTQTTTTRRWYIAVSSADSLTSFGSTSTNFATHTGALTGGVLAETTATSAVSIPANRYFVLGAYSIYFRNVKALTPARTAYLNSEPVVTALNQIYWAPQANITMGGVPNQLGGARTDNTLYTGLVFMDSVKFKLV